jgi:hypothetical protein
MKQGQNRAEAERERERERERGFCVFMRESNSYGERDGHFIVKFGSIWKYIYISLWQVVISVREKIKTKRIRKKTQLGFFFSFLILN